MLSQQSNVQCNVRLLSKCVVCRNLSLTWVYCDKTTEVGIMRFSLKICSVSHILCNFDIGVRGDFVDRGDQDCSNYRARWFWLGLYLGILQFFHFTFTEILMKMAWQLPPWSRQCGNASRMWVSVGRRKFGDEEERNNTKTKGCRCYVGRPVVEWLSKAQQSKSRW